ncbi:glucan-alpha-1,4-glucosidase-like protein [Trichodelitschia bisporula]|uniref:glucan 1,4-alpha-glucosidase n=1 Tax=Trichodelitschia bisporula TaxID=703511 RepID=A0A6G1HKT8_9PEZI|nr:glucan-alpha-1,4-glucosidase-like protein [Trichodelitschia bisporula]
MTVLFPFIVVAYLFLDVYALLQPQIFIPTHAWKASLNVDLSLDAWLQEEEKIALDNLLKNIAPGGSNCPDCVPGTVIASPSHAHPDYYYQWTRDAALTASTLVSFYSSDPHSYLSQHSLNPFLTAYTSLTSLLQSTPSLAGLGEPKFYVNATPYTLPWGRPQHDGPALRALTLISWIHALNMTYPERWAANRDTFSDIYKAEMPPRSPLKADLEYVAQYWNQQGFDLWEEVSGMHFFTAAVQARALKEGAKIAYVLGDPGAGDWYIQQAAEVDNMLLRFRDSSKGYIIETFDSDRSGLDCGVLLGAVHGTRADGSLPLPVFSDEVLATLLGLVKDMATRFPINAADDAADTDPLRGVGIGRYPEDGYDGYELVPGMGNPWFLCTSTVAQVLYLRAARAQSVGVVNVTDIGVPFWRALLRDDNLQSGAGFAAGETKFDTILARLKAVGDDFLAVVRKHTDEAGSLSEQFDREKGFERGARDLTWSYAAFLEAVWARKGLH